MCSMFTLHVSCMPNRFPAQFALLPQMRMTEALMIFFSQYWSDSWFTGPTLINEIYQPFRSFLLDEGSVILIAKECIDIKTRMPTLEIEWQWENCFLLVPLPSPTHPSMMLAKAPPNQKRIRDIFYSVATIQTLAKHSSNLQQPVFKAAEGSCFIFVQTKHEVNTFELPCAWG